MINFEFSDKTRFTVMDKRWLKSCAVALMAAFIAVAPAISYAQEDTAAENAPPADQNLDATAVEILGNATTFLAGQAAMSVDWLVSFDVIVDGREKITYLRSGQNLMQRGVGFYSFAEFEENTREYFFDGENIQILDVEENAYVMAPFTGEFDALADRLKAEYGAKLPIWQIMSTTAKSDLLERADSAAYLGVVKFAGREAHHLAFSDYNKDWQVWISTDAQKPEVLMIVGTDPYTQGWPQYRVYFSNWNFDPEIAEGAFTFVPDENSERMAWPKPGDVTLGNRGN